MPGTVGSVLGRVGLACSIATALYATLLGVLLTPSAQRFAIYAHKVNTLFLGDDLNDPEEFGFAKHQVTPFNLDTPDGETLYAWHILPLDVYTRNEKSIREETRQSGPIRDFVETNAFRLLTSNQPEPARVVVNFHGNAGHVAQGWRTDTYRNLATQPNTHVLTIDYRGFGHSTGSPTEAGLITDGIALVDWILNVASIPPERIVILGQSLGTAVSSAVALHFADPKNELIPIESRESKPVVAQEAALQSTLFAGIILVAPFSSLPSLLLTYRIGGLLPILLPLRPFPSLAGVLTAQVADTWLSAERLSAYYRSLLGSKLLTSESGTGSMGSLQLLHSVRDMDIPYHQTEMICRRIFGEGREPGVYESQDDDGQAHCIDGSRGATLLDVKAMHAPRVRFEIIEFGGHNRIVTYSPVGAAVLRAFENLFDR